MGTESESELTWFFDHSRLSQPNGAPFAEWMMMACYEYFICEKSMAMSETILFCKQKDAAGHT